MHRRVAELVAVRRQEPRQPDRPAERCDAIETGQVGAGVVELQVGRLEPAVLDHGPLAPEVGVREQGRIEVVDDAALSHECLLRVDRPDGYTFGIGCATRPRSRCEQRVRAVGRACST